ncbi:MAG: sulfite exporter TauE/SafE family protein [Saccharospirillaceae bacterium]|nr:sulfite exporter TauE/SafE family protein [Pseudomonadales bacterium]NRB77984.1 sulfite exporter TauE/SafE family protein [Saccharospirillaceae bacterium]
MLTGVIAGLIAGLFGVGGGLIIVPILVTIFTLLQFDPQWIMHMAVGTSMATILFTSLSAIWVHHQKQAILWKTVFLISIGVSVGTWLGVKLLSGLSNQTLQIIFACFLIYVSFSMWRKTFKFKVIQNNKVKKTSNPYMHTPSGVIIGLVSSLFGIGGGTLTVPYLSKMAVPIKKAVATSSACGWFIAFFASISFIFAQDTGWQFSTGWIYWPAMLSIVLTSLIFARIGAKLAHRLNSASLTKWFALLLFLLSIKMVISVLISF